MAKDIIYECGHCGAQTHKWAGRCAECGKWNTIEMTAKGEGTDENQAQKTAFKKLTLAKFSEIKQKETKLATGVGEIDRVLGGGLVPGSVVLVGGEPGLGKSTLFLQMLASLQEANCYVSGEESLAQVKQRADRLAGDYAGVDFLEARNVDDIIGTLQEHRPAVVVVDSIQTMTTSLAEGAAGGISQVNASAGRLIEYAKESGTAIVIIGHVTKSGNVAGPRMLEHAVDAVMYLEGEKKSGLRMLRGVKNRFGATAEVGLFKMQKDGLQPISDPTGILVKRGREVAGVVTSLWLEGVRPILSEVQALVAPTSFGYPRRTAAGMELNKLLLIIAIIAKKVKLDLSGQDVYLNIPGGIKVKGGEADLAAAMALVSAFYDRSMPAESIFVGELGLSGEISSVPGIEKGLMEAARLGFKKAFIPEMNIKSSKIELVKCADVGSAVKAVFGK